MLKAKDFRKQAWTGLKGKWGTLALCQFIVSLIMGACSALSYYYVGGVGLVLLSGPLTMGMAMLALSVVRNEEVNVNKLFDGFKHFVNAFALHILNSILIALWSILLIIPGIIKSLSYGMSFYILSDNPDMGANEARKLSMKMMKGHKWRLFCLYFSYIGWWILCGITLGILSFWIAPYQNSAVAAFYQNLLAEQNAQNAQNAPAEVPAVEPEVQPEVTEVETEENNED